MKNEKVKKVGGPTTAEEIMNTFIDKFAGFLQENRMHLEGKVHFMFEVADRNDNVHQMRFHIDSGSEVESEDTPTVH